MLQYQNQFKKFLSQYTIEHLLNALILVIVIIVILLATIASMRPISLSQYHKVKELAVQEVYPETQSMAQHMLYKEKIYRVDYMRLMHAEHFESSRIQHYQSDLE